MICNASHNFKIIFYSTILTLHFVILQHSLTISNEAGIVGVSPAVSRVVKAIRGGVIYATRDTDGPKHRIAERPE